jgi:hypothetical protein
VTGIYFPFEDEIDRVASSISTGRGEEETETAASRALPPRQRIAALARVPATHSARIARDFSRGAAACLHTHSRLHLSSLLLHLIYLSCCHFQSIAPYPSFLSSIKAPVLTRILPL